MCVSNNINPVFNLSSNLSICFHQFPNHFVLFITFKIDNRVVYDGVIFQMALNAFGKIVCKLNSTCTIVVIKMHDGTCKDPRFNT